MDLFLANCFKSLHDTQVVEKGLSDFNKMNITALQMFYTKQVQHSIGTIRHFAVRNLEQSWRMIRPQINLP